MPILHAYISMLYTALIGEVGKNMHRICHSPRTIRILIMYLGSTCIYVAAYLKYVISPSATSADKS